MSERGQCTYFHVFIKRGSTRPTESAKKGPRDASAGARVAVRVPGMPGGSVHCMWEFIGDDSA